MCFKKVAQLDKSALLPLLAQFNYYIDESQDIDEKMTWLNWILNEYTQCVEENEFGALVGKGKAYMSCGQYYCDVLEGMEVAGDEDDLDPNGETGLDVQGKQIESSGNEVFEVVSTGEISHGELMQEVEEIKEGDDVPAQQLLELAAECFEGALALLKHDIDTQLMCLLGETFINLGNVLEMTSEVQGTSDAYYRKAVNLFKEVKKVGGGKVPEQFMELIEAFEEDMEK